MKRNGLLVVVVVGIAVLAYRGPTVSAQSGPSLGMAQSFAILGGSSVTVASTGSAITGDVGVSPGTSISGFPAGGVVQPPYAIHNNDGAAINAQAATTALYTLLQGMSGATPLGPELGATVVGPGVYSFSSTANIASGTVFTLSGAGPYIFKVGTSVTANVGSSMLLLAGASPCNVFWQVNNAATINGAEFAGTVVAQDAITVGSGGRLDGRALTTALGSVTLAGGNVIGGCSTPANGCPTITLSPSTLPGGTVGVAYNQAIVGSGGSAPYTFAGTAGALPPGLALSSTGLLTGTPTAVGPATFTITATDANGCAASVTYTVAVAAAPLPCPTIAFAPATMPNATVGVPYSQALTGSGGTAPYVFTSVGGALPAGITLTTPTVMAGTPTAAGSSAFTLRVTDANACFAERSLTVLTVTAVPTLPEAFVLVLALGLTGVGYLRLRRRVRR
ncbi:MAG: ice-binding family protein [Acidobacteriota bacterium]